MNIQKAIDTCNSNMEFAALYDEIRDNVEFCEVDEIYRVNWLHHIMNAWTAWRCKKGMDV